MANVLSSGLYRVGCSTEQVYTIMAAYNPAGGVKGSLRFMAITEPGETTGQYIAQIKNLTGNLLNAEYITQGMLLQDYSKIIGLDVNLEYTNLTDEGMDSSYYRGVTVNVNTSDLCIYIYTRDISGDLADISSGDVIQVTPYFTNGVSNFGETEEGSAQLLSMSPMPKILPFFLNLADQESPTITGLIPSCSASQVSSNIYQVYIPYSAKSILALRGTLSVAKNGDCDSDISFTVPTIDATGITFQVAVKSMSGGDDSSAYNGIYITLELTNGLC